MKTYRLAVSILCVSLLLAFCQPAVCCAEFMPFAESGNLIWATLSFSNGKAIGEGTVKKIKAGCTASTTVYVQAKSGNTWITKASGSGSRDASASCTAQKGTEYRAYAIAKIYDSNETEVDEVKSYSSSSIY